MHIQPKLARPKAGFALRPDRWAHAPLAALAAALVLLVTAPIRLAAAETLKIVALGDSLFAGYQLAAGEGYTERLREALAERGIEAEIVNAAVPGDTTSAGRERLDWSVPDDSDLVLVELGANDMLRGIEPDVPRRNLTAILERLEERDIPAALFGMLANPSLGQNYAERFNTIYSDLADRFAIPYMPFVLQDVIGHPERLLADGIHPNPAGVDVMVRNTLPTVLEAIERLPAESDPAATLR